jgi:hypothetical protein
MTTEQFERMVSSQRGKASNDAGVEGKQEAKTLFAELDKDNSGGLNQQETREWYVCLLASRVAAFLTGKAQAREIWPGWIPP